MYYLEKVGSYGHGIFWIGSDIEEGKRQADNFAAGDYDRYHTWDLCEYIPSNNSESPDYNVIYSARKKE